MKKIILLAIAFGFSIYGFSQEEKRVQIKDTVKAQPSNSISKGVKYGIRGGLNISNLDFDETTSFENKHRNSMYFGAFACITLSKSMSLMPELQFSAEGANAEPLHLDYIQVPLLAKIYLVDGLSLQAGPSFNFLVNEEIDYEPTNNGGDINIVDGANDFEFGTAAGLEYKFDNGLFIQGRYTRGFTKIYDDVKAYNYAIQAGVGFVF